MIFYSLFTFLGPVLLAWMGAPSKWAVAVVAVISGAPIIIVFWLLGRFLRETDEYVRKVQTDALLGGGAVTLSICVIWGFLELYLGLFGVTSQHSSFPAVLMVGPAFFFFYGLSFIWQRLQSGGSLSGVRGNDESR
jgi:hypothetical protein